MCECVEGTPRTPQNTDGPYREDFIDVSPVQRRFHIEEHLEWGLGDKPRMGSLCLDVFPLLALNSVGQFWSRTGQISMVQISC